MMGLTHDTMTVIVMHRGLRRDCGKSTQQVIVKTINSTYLTYKLKNYFYQNIKCKYSNINDRWQIFDWVFKNWNSSKKR